MNTFATSPVSVKLNFGPQVLLSDGHREKNFYLFFFVDDDISPVYFSDTVSSSQSYPIRIYHDTGSQRPEVSGHLSSIFAPATRDTAPGVITYVRLKPNPSSKADTWHKDSFTFMLLACHQNHEDPTVRDDKLITN